METRVPAFDYPVRLCLVRLSPTCLRKLELNLLPPISITPPCPS